MPRDETIISTGRLVAESMSVDFTALRSRISPLMMFILGYVVLSEN